MLSRRDKVDCHVSQVPAYFSAWKKGAEDDEMAKLFQAILVKVFVFFYSLFLGLLLHFYDKQRTDLSS